MKWLTAILVLSLSSFIYGQEQLSGVVTDEEGLPIPFAKVYVKNEAGQRTLANVDGYYEMRLLEGEYFLVFSATGYDDREAYVTMMTGQPVVKDMQLFPRSYQNIQSVNVSAKKGNPGREIMLKVAEKRDQINPWKYQHTVEGYIKAVEKIDRKEGKKKKNNEEEEEESDPDGIHDPFAAEEAKKNAEIQAG